MAFATVDGARLFHTEVGAGLPCLVMHGGLGVDHTQFRAGLDPLGDVLRLVYYDHRCNGRSDRPPIQTLTLERLAADADALREQLGLDRVAVLGHSWGGCVALRYALDHPERVSHLVLVGTTAAWDHRAEIAEGLRRRAPAPDVLAAFLEPPTDDASFAIAQRRIAAELGFGHRDAGLAERLYADTVWDAAACARSRELMAECDVVGRLAALRMPTLVLVGRHDVFCPPSQAARLADGIRGAQRVVFEASGHYPFVEEPAAFQGALRAWLTHHAA